MGAYVSVRPLGQCECMAVERGNAKYVAGSVFSDEVGAAVEDTRRGLIMLMQYTGSSVASHWVVSAAEGTCPGFVGLMLSLV